MDLEQYLTETKKTEKEWQEEAHQVAENRVKASLVLQTLAEELKITVSEAEVSQKLAELKKVYQKDENLTKQLDDPRVQADIKNRLRIEKTLEALVKANA